PNPLRLLSSQPTLGRVRPGRPLDEASGDRLTHSATYNREVCDLPRQELLGHDADEIVRRRDGAALDRHDDIASDGNLLALELALLGSCNEAGTCSRRPCTDPADDGAARNREVKPARNSRREALC